MTSSSNTSDGENKAGRPNAADLGEAMPGDQQEAYVFPLTPPQRRLWSIQKADPDTTSYNGAFLLEITGPLWPQRLEAAFNAVVARHEILRAYVREVDGEPMLAIAPQLTVKCSVGDLRLLSREVAEARLVALTKAEACTPFDLANAPLVRIGLIQMSDTRSILMLTLHQAICDGYSLGEIVIELTKAYATLAAGDEPDLTPPALQFGDYAAWLDTQVSSGAFAGQMDFWRQQLADYRRFDVPGDVDGGVEAGLDSGATDIAARLISQELADKLRATVASEGGTLFTASLTALAVVLSAAAKRADFSVGVPVVGRDHADLEKVIGPLINYMVLQADVEGGLSFRELERRVREDAFDCFANQNVPLETIAETLAVAGRPLPDPIYSVCFVSQVAYGSSNPARDFADCHLRSLPSVSSGAIYDMFVFLVARETGYRLSVDYRPDRYSAARVEAILDAMVGVIERVAANPDLKIADLAPRHLALAIVETARQIEPVTTPAATNDDLTSDEHGEADAEFVLPASFVQERYWLLSRANPASTAFHVPVGVRIKGALDADLLARCLDALAQRHEALGTTFRSVDDALMQVIAAQRTLQLDRTDLRDIAPDHVEARLADAVAAESRQPFDLDAGPLVRSRLYQIAADEHVLTQTFHHSICDGQSIAILHRELWALYEAEQAGRDADLPELPLQYGDYAVAQRDWIGSEPAREQLAFWTKALHGALPVADFPLERAPSNQAASKTAILSRPIDPSVIARLKQLAKDAGTTMFSVTAGAYAILLAKYAQTGDVLFGCPMVNRTADTTEIFGPFAGPMAIRLDLGGDPTLRDIVDRSRDYTFDALAATDIPFDCILPAVDARSLGGRNPLFQFYFVYQQAFLQKRQQAGLEMQPIATLATGTPFELQIVMIERPEGVTAQMDYNPELLSEATVQSILGYYAGILERLASAPAARLSALPEPDLGAAKRLGTQRMEIAYAAPRTAIEEKLCGIWQELLKRPQIGINDDFFDLGGTSILAARLVLAVERAFDAKIQVSTVAFARTIAQLAAVIERPEAAGSQRLIPMRTGGNQRPLFVVHCGGGHVLRYQDLVSLLAPDQPVFGLTAPPVEEQGADVSVESLAALYLDEVRKVQPHGPYQIAGYSFGGLVAYEMARLLSLAGQQVSLLAILDTINRQHYRALPVRDQAKMVTGYVTDRAGRHIGRLRESGFKAFANEALGAAQRKLRPLANKLKRRLPQPAAPQDGQPPPNANLDIFARLAGRYRPKPYAGRVLVVHAEDRGQEYRANPTLGWEDLAAFGAEVMFVPGDHMTFMRRPNVEVLSQQLQTHLARPPRDTRDR